MLLPPRLCLKKCSGKGKRPPFLSKIKAQWTMAGDSRRNWNQKAPRIALANTKKHPKGILLQHILY